jgi:aryl-alcohol dehydrogenase-like predicted oxidoreductase
VRYGRIPNTDLNPSVICLGALPFGVSLSEEISHSLLDCFVLGGGNFIDTALVYGEWLPGGKGAFLVRECAGAGIHYVAAFPAYPLSGASNMEQLLENLQVGEVELDPGVVAYLEGGR